MRTYLRLMEAAADGTRVKILKILGQRQLCVCKIRSLLGISQPSVSRHLRLLEDADPVRGEKTARWNKFRLARPEECNAYSRAILEELEEWLEDNDGVHKLPEETKTLGSRVEGEEETSPNKDDREEMQQGGVQ